VHTWDHTVDGHRTAQREAIAAAAWASAQRHGPFSLSMSQVAAAAGVSRPTLYKYFPDVQSMLIAHHGKHVEMHVAELEAVMSGPGLPAERLQRLVGAYAEICHHRAQHGDAELDRLVHSPSELDAPESQLIDLFTRAIREAGQGEHDLSPAALAAYAVRASSAAAQVTRGKVPALARLVFESLT
jgi:AcrR family transcriptional regulator